MALTRHVVAIDVGGTSIKAAVMAQDLCSVITERVATRRVDGAADPDQIAELISDLTARAREHGFPVAAAGVAVPGIVDEDTGVVHAAVNLGWRKLALRELLAGSVPLAVGHDVRAGGLAEFTVGAAAGARDALFLPIGTGIAAAAVVDGRALSAGGYAGEIGHVVVDPGGAVCACGTRGCLETLASASGIARRYTELAGETVTAAQVATRTATGDPVAARVWRDAVEALATALAAAVTLLGTRVVVVGGGLAEAGETLLAPLRAELAGRLSFQRPVTVLRAALGDGAGCTGAALLALRTLP